MNTTYSREEIDGVAAALRQMPPPDKKKRRHGAPETIGILMPEINKQLRRGHSLDDIAQAIRGAGIDVSTSTLKRYMNKAARRAAARTPNAPGSSADAAPSRGDDDSADSVVTPGEQGADVSSDTFTTSLDT